MESFPGTCSDVDHGPTLTECDHDFGLATSHHHSTSEYHGREWDGFFNSVEHDSPTRCGFDLPDLPLTSEPNYGAVAGSGLPLVTPFSTTSSNFSTLTPPSTATESALTWSAPATSQPPSVFSTGLWRPDSNLHTFHSGNFDYERLGIHLFNPHHPYGADGDAYPLQLHDHPSNDCLAQLNREHNGILGCVQQPRTFQHNTIDDEDDNEADGTDPCYAKLLWTCLKEAPGHTLSLKELYEWVAQNSQKAKDLKTRGWQNSVRHNLSMNAAFERVPPGANLGAKKGSLWRLTDKALKDGVISTTRYRKDPKRKPERRSHPTPKRQISGAKGGQATRAATRHRREMQHVRSLPHLSSADRYDHYQSGRNDGIMSPYLPHSTSHSPQLMMLPSPVSSYPFAIGHEEIVPPLPTYRDKMTHIPGFFGDDANPVLPNFEIQPFDLANGSLFPDQDDAMPDTPSIGTEGSFMTDGLPGLLSRDVSRETTIF